MQLLIMIGAQLTALVVSAVVSKRRYMALVSMAAATVAMAEAMLIAYRVAKSGIYAPSPLVYVNQMSAIVLLIVGVVGFFAMAYSIPYLDREARKGIIGNRRVKQYFVLVNLFLAAMYISITASQPVVTWIFLEGTTLATAFLISFYNKPSSIEAAWKYLIINSTGLLLGFFGTLLFLTPLTSATQSGPVTWSTLLSYAGHMDPTVVKVAFVFILIGYGTKAGLAPMHTWKPDAYSKTPAPIGALFSGALLPVAFLALIKFKAVTDAVVGASYSQGLLMIFGIVSIAVGAFSILTVRNYKRMLAYSSVEHAGIIALGFGFGGLGAFAAILHMILHSLVKSALFFVSGNLLVKFHSARIINVRGAVIVLPVTAVLFFAGFIAIAGLPPFGMFLTEVMILSAGIKTHLGFVLAAMAALAVAFIGLFRQSRNMMLGDKPPTIEPGEDSLWLIVPPLAMLTIALIISLYIPDFLQTLLHQAAKF